MGAGYRQIANRLNLSRDAVRYYCKANDLNGHREAVLSNTQRIKTDENFCSCCGELLVQPKTGRKRRFCCEACRRKWWGQNRDKVRKSPEAIYGFTCKRCGKEFTAYRGGRLVFFYAISVSILFVYCTNFLAAGERASLLGIMMPNLIYCGGSTGILTISA